MSVEAEIPPVEPNSSFSKAIPNLQIAWDQTSIGELKTCPRLYYYNIICGWTLSGGFDPNIIENPHLKFGQLFASACEDYNHLRAAGLDHEASLIKVIHSTLLKTIDPERTIKNPETGEETTIPPRVWLSDEPTKTQKTLLRTLILYFDKFQDDPIKTIVLSNGKAAVEFSFSIDLAEVLDNEEYTAPSGESYILCGHIDRIGEWTGIWILDNKTTKGQLDDRYFANYSPDNQVSAYDVAGNIVLKTETEGVIIDAAQVLVGGSRFQRRPIPRTAALREEWLTDLKFYFRMNEEYVRLNYWPQNDKSCIKFGRRCQFADVCSADPSVRDDLLNAFYTRRKTWDPLRPRGIA